MILVTILTALAFVFFLINLPENGETFIDSVQRNSRLILLQAITLLVQYGCYMWLNRLIVASITQKTSYKSSLPVLKYPRLIVQLLLIIYVLGPVSNYISFYLLQDYFNGIPQDITSILPLHPQPIINTFGGLGVAAFYTTLYLVYAGVREMLINYINKEPGRRELRILTVNQVTLNTMLCSLAIPAIFGFDNFFHYFFITPAMLLVYAANMYWLFPAKGDKPLFKSGIIKWLLLLTGVCALPIILIPRAQMTGMSVFFITAWLFNLLVVTPVAWFSYRQQKDKITQLRGMETALTRSRADIQFLRSQINPHFLFNVLNTLYGTALQEGSERTAEGIQRLGDMMRFMLYDNNLETIPMSREIEYLNNYIALQRLRIQSSPNIQIETNIPADGCNHNIAPMLLIPFVENAFKHGISLAEQSHISVNLTCSEKQLYFEVRNSMHAKQDNDTEKDRSGIGIVNVVERLKIIYPGKHKLVFNGDGREFFVQLNIQF